MKRAERRNKAACFPAPGGRIGEFSDVSYGRYGFQLGLAMKDSEPGQTPHQSFSLPPRCFIFSLSLALSFFSFSIST